MAQSVIQTNFATGEIAPALFGHTDLAKVRASVTTGRNMFVGYRGGMYSRAGTRFISRSPQAGTLLAPRIIPFQFSTTQGYVLEFGEKYLRFTFDGGTVLETAKVITGATQANPAQITSVTHGFSNGDWVVIAGVAGMTELNGNTYIVAGASANTFTLQNQSGTAINSAAYGAYVSSGTASRIYQIDTPYAAADQPLLKFVQSADVISLTHPNHPTYDLARAGATNWSLTAVSFGSVIAAPANIMVSATVQPSGALLPCAYAYVVTAIDRATGQESVASAIGDVTDGVDIAATLGSNKISWAAVSGANQYAIYKAPTSYNTDPGSATDALPVPIGSPFGYIGTAFGNEFVDSNITADFAKTPPLHRDPFALGPILAVTIATSVGTWTTVTVGITTATGTGFVGRGVIVGGNIVAVLVITPGSGYLSTDTPTFTGDGTSASGTLTVGPLTGTYPSVVSYFQQRRYYGNTINSPDTYWLSQPGAFKNFDSSIPPIDSDAITGTPWAEQVNGIQWAVSMPLGLVTFTSDSVWQVGASSTQIGSPAALTPTSQIAVPQNSVGSSALVEPTKINWDIIYVEQDGAAVRALSYQFYFNNYIGVDVSWQSSHLLIGHKIIQRAWCQKPYRIWWALRDDGVLLSMTYLKEQEVTGWARHDTKGKVVSICSVYENSADALYLVVQRIVGGEFRYFIERMDDRTWGSFDVTDDDCLAGVEDVWAVDSALGHVVPFPNSGIVASVASGPGAIFETDAAVFASGDVDKILRMGGGIAKVTNYTNSQMVVGTWLYPCQLIMPDDPGGHPMPQAAGTWSLTEPVTEIGGLSHIAGETVTGLADGAVISPRVVSAAGKITLDYAATAIVVGLGFTAQFQSVYLDSGQPTIQGRRKAISGATIRIESSAAPQIGANQIDASTLSPPPYFVPWSLPSRPPLPADAPAPYLTASGAVVQPLYTGDLRARVASDWRKPGQVAVQQSQPLPLNVLDVVVESLAGDTPEVELSQRRQPQQRQRRQAAA